MDKELTIRYSEYAKASDLTPTDRELAEAAERSAQFAYAPYSHFKVGAAVRLSDGRIVCGNNQENAAYPSGLCAERTALFAASAQYPDADGYDAIAIVGIDAEGHRCEASPCGACRQVMAEYEQRQRRGIRVLCCNADGGARVFGSVRDLLPFGFEF